MSKVLNPQSFFDDRAVLELCDELGVKLEHANILWRYLTRNHGSTFTDCPKIPKKFYQALNEKFVPLTSTVEKVYTSEDNSTVKLLVRLQDGNLVETVIMRYDRKNNPALVHRPRSTVCISSQVGCKMGCTFCATGTMGFSSHLTAGEIVEQLVHANKIEPIKNVVFMGMGEPLDNYDNVVTAIRTMVDQRKFNLGPAHVCVSTVGVIPRMKQLLRDVPGIRLALSLHAPTQDMRLRIVPTAKAYPIEKLLAVVDSYLAVGKVMIEYIVIGDVNDAPETARILGELFRGKNVIVNLIPYNPTDVAENFIPPSHERVVQFEKILQQEYSILATIRRTMGQDIEGACGQLVVKHGGNSGSDEKENEGGNGENCNSSGDNCNNSEKSKEPTESKTGIKDMEDLCSTATPKQDENVTESQSFWGNIFKIFF